MPRPNVKGRVTLISTLGLTPAVVLETFALLYTIAAEKDVYVIRTRHEAINKFSNVLKGVFKRLGVDYVDGFVVDSSDITSPRDNAKFIDVFTTAVRSAQGSVVVSIAGGRKTMSAMATYISLAHHDHAITDKINFLVHVLVPASVEDKCSRTCSYRHIMQYIDMFDVDKIADAIKDRFIKIVNEKTHCSDTTTCPSEINSVDDLATCFLPCIPKSVVVIPGRELIKNPERVLALVSLAYEKVGDRLSRIININVDKFNDIRSDPIKYGLHFYVDVNNAASVREFVDNILDNMEPGESLPRRRSGIELEFRGFSESRHHASMCGSLDPKLEGMFRGDRPPASYVWKVEAADWTPRDTGHCSVDKGIWDRREDDGSFVFEPWIKCRGKYAQVRLYLTAITRRQAEVMAGEIARYLKDRELC